LAQKDRILRLGHFIQPIVKCLETGLKVQNCDQFQANTSQTTICFNMSGVKMPKQDAVFRKQQNEYSNETQSQPVTNGETIDEPCCPKVLSR
jgi:hypothetical protein